MTTGGRIALIVVGGLALLGGGGYAAVEAGYLPNPFAPKPPATLSVFVVTWPQTFYQAKTALINLSVISIENIDTQTEVNAHAEAQAIRAVYPGAGPAGGYTCQQLVAMGKIDPSYCSS